VDYYECEVKVTTWMKGLRKSVRANGLWLSAEEALVIERAIYRAHIMKTEAGADVIERFLRRCQELKRD
jgi:hypothetical protein